MQQFAAHVRARVTPGEESFARTVLTPAAWELFAGMPVADRRHGLDVAARLRAAGHREPDVMTAALLHDAAKGHRMRLWHRVAGVLLEAVTPSVLRRLASPHAGSWRHPFWLYLHHAEVSSQLAERAGCTPASGRLIRGEPQGESEARLASALRTADDAS